MAIADKLRLFESFNDVIEFVLKILRAVNPECSEDETNHDSSFHFLAVSG